MLNLESLQDKRHRVQAGQHAEIEQRRGPAEPGSVLGRGSRRMIHHQELEVGRHAEQGGTSQNGLSVLADSRVYNPRGMTLTLSQ